MSCTLEFAVEFHVEVNCAARWSNLIRVVAQPIQNYRNYQRLGELSCDQAMSLRSRGDCLS